MKAPSGIAPTTADREDHQRLVPIMNEVQQADIPHMEVLMDRLAKHQPFLMSMLVGYHKELAPHVYEVVARSLLIVWRFHEDAGRATAPLSEEGYIRAYERNLRMLHYAQGEPDMDATTAIYKNDLEAKPGRMVPAALIHIFTDDPALHGQSASFRGERMMELNALNDAFKEADATAKLDHG
jgi:hypothetical protein